MRRQLKGFNASGLVALALSAGLLSLPLQAAAGDYTAIPDAQFEQALIDRGIDSEGTLDGQVLTADLATASTISADEYDIEDLTGIEAAVSLKSLLLYGNRLTTLNLANNPVLATLKASRNALYGILDLSGKPDLISVDLTLNPNLVCVQVDSAVDYYEFKTGTQYQGWSLDPTTMVSENCSADFPGF